MEEWTNDPSNYKWGEFYFNKKDKRIFPPRRIKLLGWTVNFANPYSILALIGIFILIFILDILDKLIKSA
ncbi:MAG TPA: hypothetical protein DIT07_09540 [Sphingobacteriaceae bacterium]|nr:hypothetical protein [Sphingobacteriaceae bacterium]